MEEQQAPKRASLLGIPRELRLQIYDYLFHMDLDCEFLGFYKTPWDPNPFRKEGAQLRVPWVNAMLSCKYIASEIRELVQAKSFMEDIEIHTYVLDLHTSPFGVSSMKCAVWRKLPCAPGQVDNLIVNFILPDTYPMHAFGGDGGVTESVCSLFESLNLLLRCGPAFDPTRRLPSYMGFEKISVRVQQANEEAFHEPGDECAPDVCGLWSRCQARRRVAKELLGLVHDLNRHNILYGYVDDFSVECKGYAKSITDLGDLGWKMPEDRKTGYEQYGYHWVLRACDRT